MAELGAFTANATIQKSLRVVIQQHYDVVESFVRYGPIERIKKVRRRNLAVYPWRMHANGTLNIKSTEPHYRPILSFVSDEFEAVPNSTTYGKLGEAELFYVVYWIVYLCLAVSIDSLNYYVRLLVPSASNEAIRNKLYCMKLAGWIDTISYAAGDYAWARNDEDPFEYEFKMGVSDRTSSMRRKLAVQMALRKAEQLPKWVEEQALKPRAARAP